MAVAPTFVPTMADLLQRLKLDGAVMAGSVAETNTSIQEVALGFFRRLGAARIAAIKTITYTDTPVTADDFLRLCSVLTEVAWVRQKLLHVKPVLFQDASAKALQLFNDEGAFARQGSKAVAEEIAHLSAVVEDGLLALEGGVTIAETEIHATTIGPCRPNDLPGASAFPALRRHFRGFPFNGARPVTECNP